MEISNTFVILMGLGIVFIGLICIIYLCYIMSYFVQKFAKPTPVQASASTVAPAPAKSTIANRQEFIAAVSAVIAEELGRDVSAIKILSVKEL